MKKGFIAGVVATIPMTLLMLWIKKRLTTPEQFKKLPPEKITENVLNQVLPPPAVQKETVKGTFFVFHFLFGGIAGALYEMMNRGHSGVSKGMLFGLLVWFISYQGWLPATNLYPPILEQPKERNMLMLLAHLVWGGATGWLTPRVIPYPALSLLPSSGRVSKTSM